MASTRDDTPRPRHAQLAWAFYDWANSAFATTVMAGFFPVFFKQYWAGELAVTDSTFWLGAVNSLASVIVVLLAPVLGAIADQGGYKKAFLLRFAAMGVLATGGLFLVAQGQWPLALALYVLGVLGFSGGNIFYDALLIDVADPHRLDRLSALGFALGYLGGGLLFAFDVIMVLQPGLFGLADEAAAIRVAFLTVAGWWALFSIPVLLWVEERRPVQQVTAGAAVARGLRQLVATAREIRRLRVTFLFLLAYWFYIDGVDTIVRMAVDYGLALGFDAAGLMTALLVTQFVGFPAAIVFGRIGERIGPKQGIWIGIAVYIGVVLWAYRMQTTAEFYALAVAIGLVQGGIQALSRSLYARLVPAHRAGEFFGFFNMLGKFAAVFGPVLMGWVAVLTASPRASILAVLVLFVIGGALLVRVDVAAGERQARAADPLLN